MLPAPSNSVEAARGEPVVSGGMNEAQNRAIVEAIEQEQQRLAQVLHDTVCQSLGGMQLLTHVLAGKLQASAPELVPELADLSRLGHDAAQEVRQLMASLRSQPLGDANLVAALQELAEQIAPQVPCAVECADNLPVTDGYAASQLYLIAQRAVKYAAQRQGVTRIVVSLLDRAGRLTLSVHALGGSSEAPAAGSAERLFGWDLERRRAAAIGATLEVGSAGGESALVTCRLG